MSVKEAKGMKRKLPDIGGDDRVPLMDIHPLGCAAVMIGTFALATLVAWKIGMFDPRPEEQIQPTEKR